LAARNFFFAEITNQANADPEVIHVSGLTMGTILLFNPTRGCFNMAVFLASAAIINDKVIPCPVKSTLSMGIKNRQGIAGFRSTVMDNNVFPLIRWI